MKTGRTLLRICVYVGSVVAGSAPVIFVISNLDFIRDKTISAGQNADFGGFLRSKAGSAGRFLVRCPFIGILISSAASGTCAVERFAVAHPSQQSWAPSHRAADGHAFRSAHVPRALCSTDISCKQNGVKNGTFLHRLFHFIQLV